MPKKDKTDLEQLKELDGLAREVLVLSRNTLLVNLRFLDAALSEFSYVLFPTESLGTDGRYLFYNPVQVLRRYREEKEIPVRDYLHLVMHSIFRHMYGAAGLDHEMWDLAADIAVENAITELDIRAASVSREGKEKEIFRRIWADIGKLTAEKIYRYFKTHPAAFQKQKAELEELFRHDDHTFWYLPPEKRREQARGEDGKNGGDGKESPAGALPGEGSEDPAAEAGSGAPGDSGEDPQEKRWKEISERMQMDLETFSKKHGDNAGGLIQNLREVNREKYDYTSFLRKFAVRGEVMKVNEDEFDYVYYTYGLQVYEKMPLIEPLEYKEALKIREFVIAIDTSGSVSGKLVQAFVQKTYNILKSTESFFSRINLHIIQCDAAIQEHVKITTQEEFDFWIRNMKLKGFGGTDFRPVFRLVDELVRQKEFTNLRGLIYFTDGYGTFPKRKPDYEAAFVFIRDYYETPLVPPWAIKLVLEKEDI